MEYKGDEIWTFEHVQDVRAGGPLPMLGMPTSQYFLNPGMSLWVFLPLAEIAQVKDPVDLCRAVQVVNVLALFGLVAFGLRIVPRAEREVWLWAAALVSVNPLAVLSHRKIWPPCVFPIIIMAFLLSWWRRDKRVGAFCWGLIGACLGQIQGAGFFFAAGFALWAFLFDRRRVQWGSWFVGSCVGSLQHDPWLLYMLAHTTARPTSSRRSRAAGCIFWKASSGRAGPWSRSASASTTAWIAISAISSAIRWSAGMRLTWSSSCTSRSDSSASAIVVFALAAASRRNWSAFSIGAAFVGRESATAFTQNAALWGYGLVVTLSMLPIHRPYMIILFPLQFLWLARLARSEPPERAERSQRWDGPCWRLSSSARLSSRFSS